MAKEFLDPTIFTDPIGALGLLAKSIKKASEYDRNKDKNVFEAVVISPPATEVYSDGNTRTKVYVRLDTQTKQENYPPGHAFLPNPCDLTTQTENGNPEKALALVKMHTAVYITQVEEDSGINTVTINDRILVRLNPNVFGYDMSEAEYVSAIKKKKKYTDVPEGSNEGCKSLAKLFAKNLKNATSIAAAQTALGEETDEFYQKLRDSTHFKGFSDAFLMGLAANAQAESRCSSNAPGDPRKTTSGGNANAIESGGTAYCSFGYWQLNVCPSLETGSSYDAEGSLFIKQKGLGWDVSRDDKAGILAAITNSENQFAFVAKRLREIEGTKNMITSTSAPAAAEAIAVYFENCQECAPAGGVQKGKTSDIQTVARMGVAEKLYDEITNFGESSTEEAVAAAASTEERAVYEGGG